MNITLKNIKDHGNAEKERLILSVKLDDDIGRYVVFDTRATDEGKVSNLLKRAYWFPDQPVSAGDQVILYTRKGEPKVKRNTDGSRSYFYYWGLNQPIWDSGGDYAVLLQVKNWEVLPAPGLPR